VHVTPIMCAFEVVRPPPEQQKRANEYFISAGRKKNVSSVNFLPVWGMKNGSWEAAFQEMRKLLLG